jgi:hypothetical protein
LLLLPKLLLLLLLLLPKLLVLLMLLPVRITKPGHDYLT